MTLQIFVEDALVEAYEVLALRALGLPTRPRNRSRVRASRVEPRDLATLEGLKDLLQRAVRSGARWVMFVLDAEHPQTSPERAGLLQGFEHAFEALCRKREALPEQDPLRRVNIVRVVCRPCLEGWLLADPRAIVDAVRGRHGVGYLPAPRSTDSLSPAEAAEQIAHHIRQVGRQLERVDLQRTDRRSVKSLGGQIAGSFEPERAQSHNSSLAYFLSMVDGRRDGCAQPFPG